MKNTILLTLCAILFVVGCSAQAESDQEQEIRIYEVHTAATGHCDLVSSTDHKDELRTTTGANEFRMFDVAFMNNIACHSNADCFEFLMASEEYRNLVPEFEPYMFCNVHGPADSKSEFRN